MKTIKIAMYITLISLSTLGSAQLKFTKKMLGINRLPSYTLDVEGTARFSNLTDVIIDWSSGGAPVLYPENQYGMYIGKNGHWINQIFSFSINYNNLYKTSDIVIKENMQPLSNVLLKIGQLKPYSYYYKDEYFKGYTDEEKIKARKIEYGFVAQELKSVFPELVLTPDSGLMAIDYVSMIPILVEAIKEQQSVITKLEASISAINAEMREEKKSTQSINEDLSAMELTGTLDQNHPNPYGTSTEIGYFVPDQAQKANIYIYSMNGLQLKSIPINTMGRGKAFIYGSELAAGMYIYTLVIDGEEADTKRMILTE